MFREAKHSRSEGPRNSQPRHGPVREFSPRPPGTVRIPLHVLSAYAGKGCFDSRRVLSFANHPTALSMTKAVVFAVISQKHPSADFQIGNVTSALAFHSQHAQS